MNRQAQVEADLASQQRRLGEAQRINNQYIGLNRGAIKNYDAQNSSLSEVNKSLEKRIKDLKAKGRRQGNGLTPKEKQELDRASKAARKNAASIKSNKRKIATAKNDIRKRSGK